MPAAASSTATSRPSGTSLRALIELALDRVDHVVRRPRPLLGLTPVPLLEIRIAVGEALHHRALVDLLLVPVGQLPLHLAAVVARRLDHGRNVLPIEDLNARHFAPRTN